MKIEKLANSELSLEFERNGKEYEELRNTVLAKFKNVKVDGFRKGHVPADVIEKTFADDIRNEIIDEVLREDYTKFLESKEYRPVSELQITNLVYNKDELKVEAKVAIFPEFELPQYKGLNVELEEVSVTDEEVDEEIKKMLERAKTFVKAEREVAELGDVAIIDFEGFVNGVAFDGGKAEGHRLELGSKTFIDNFEEQIVGHKIGEEFDVNVNFPEAYHSEELKGKPAVFKIKLNALEVPKLPELDEEFAKGMGYASVQELKDSVKGNVLSSKESKAKEAKLDKVVEQVVNATEVEVPSILVEKDIDNYLGGFANQLKMQGMTFEQFLSMSGNTLEKMRESLRENATKSVKSGFVFSKIADVEGITVTDEEFNHELGHVASMYGMTVQGLEEELEKANGLDRFREQITSQLFFAKMNEFLLNNN
ncbi:trigger factor [Pseudostreptobacillus hongkongensis]|uniref:trigger factor n=1 Tax=Pseudostreptobacillus hongkongensis TaxID=1162717 RepID=UPI0028D3BF28|nr:trigger factor [Pseudostreptobacillus hongkongensis]